jgi:hypothetical protein
VQFVDKKVELSILDYHVLANPAIECVKEPMGGLAPRDVSSAPCLFHSLIFVRPTDRTVRTPSKKPLETRSLSTGVRTAKPEAMRRTLSSDAPGSRSLDIKALSLSHLEAMISPAGTDDFDSAFQAKENPQRLVR